MAVRAGRRRGNGAAATSTTLFGPAEHPLLERIRETDINNVTRWTRCRSFSSGNSPWPTKLRHVRNSQPENHRISEQ